MDLRIFTEPQEGATYDEIVAAAQEAERHGFDAFFRSDHYQRIHPGDAGVGSSDAWITLAGLARDTSTIRLGTLVTPATFRLPGALAISVANVDAMSGGRVELGLGSGWYDGEHAAYGIPFPGVKERFDRLEEQLEIVTGLWDAPAGETYSFAGEHYSLTDSPALPKPVQSPHPPIIVGGGGPRHTPQLAARFADEFNFGFASVEDTAAGFDRVRAACEAIGRDPRSITLSVAHPTAVGRDTAEIERRAQAAGQPAEHLRNFGVCGTPEEVVERLHSFADVGATRAYLQLIDMTDLDQIRLIAEEVLPHV